MASTTFFWSSSSPPLPCALGGMHCSASVIVSTGIIARVMCVCCRPRLRFACLAIFASSAATKYSEDRLSLKSNGSPTASMWRSLPQAVLE